MKMLNSGSLNIDTTFFVASHATGGETVAASDRNVSFGGKGLNQSVSLARAGAVVFHAGKIGDDGVALRDYLAGTGVDVSLVTLSDKSTGCAMIQVDQSGENCIVVYGGSNRDVTKNDADAALDNFSAGDVLLLQNEISNVKYIAKKAKEKGMTVVLNPSPLDALDVDMDDVDMVILNETESEAIFGSSDAERVRNAVILRGGKMKVVLTLGSRGACYIDSGDVIKVDAMKVKAVDTTGAGDTFTGYFLAEYFGGATPEAALKTAAVAAGISVTKKGAATSIPERAEVEKKMKELF